MTNTNLLKSKMIIYGDNNFVQCLSTILNCSRTTASGKLSNKIPFSQNDIALITQRYNLSADEVVEIFIKNESEVNLLHAASETIPASRRSS